MPLTPEEEKQVIGGIYGLVMEYALPRNEAYKRIAPTVRLRMSVKDVEEVILKASQRILEITAEWLSRPREERDLKVLQDRLIPVFEKIHPAEIFEERVVRLGDKVVKVVIFDTVMDRAQYWEINGACMLFVVRGNVQFFVGRVVGGGEKVVFPREADYEVQFLWGLYPSYVLYRVVAGDCDEFQKLIGSGEEFIRVIGFERLAKETRGIFACSPLTKVKIKV